VQLYFPGNLARIAIAHRTCRVGVPEDFALDVLSVGLGAGKSSRLYKRLVQGRELVTSVSVHNDARLDPGLLWIVAELKEGVELAAVEEEILDEIARVRRSGLSASELGRAKRLILSGFEFERETAHDMATRLGRFEVLAADGHRLLERYPEEISKVDRERIRDVASRFLVERGRTVGWSLPEREVARGNGRAAARGLRRRAAGKRKRS
jgi:zinc protease